MKTLLGGKGAHLADMTTAGLPVPAGFITTATCAEYNEARQKLPAALMNEVRTNIAKVERPPARSSAALRTLCCSPAGRAPDLHARNDGHGAQHRPQRRSRRGHGQAHRQRALRLRLLSPPDQHVRRHRHGRGPRAVRARALHRQAAEWCSSTPTSKPRASRKSSPATSASTASTSAPTSPRARWNRSRRRSRPSSRAGWATAPSSTARSTKSADSSAPR